MWSDTVYSGVRAMNGNVKKKILTAGIYIGVTVGVYLLIKYLLPLVAPFIFAFIIAVLIEKPVDFMVKKLHWKRIVCVIIVLVVSSGAILGILFWAGSSLVEQIKQFSQNSDKYVEMLDETAYNCCERADDILGLEPGRSYDFVLESAKKAAMGITEGLGTAVMSRSVDVASGFMWLFTTITLVVMATVFFSKDLKKIRAGMSENVFSEEIDFIRIRLKDVLGTFFKTQGVIMGITCVICTIGLYIMGNPYAFLIGFLIGLVDALPVFGTGTVFLPWGIILLIMGNYKMAAGVFFIYFICYYTRQFLEPKLMGNRLGISPALMLITLYLGLVLFGISGVITGPIGGILVKEISTHLIKNL